MNDKIIMPFGKHKGSSIDDVPASYLKWFYEQDWAEKYPDVWKYCKKNWKAIEMELVEDDREYEGKEDPYWLDRR